jgi:hypothetical protein
MTATEWAHLPNAALIDRILADVAQRPKVWAAAREAAREAAWGGAWVAAWDAVRNAARDAALDAVQDAARAAARAAALDAAHDSAGGAAGGAVLALIAWDDACLLLDTPVPALRLYAANGSHAALLMLPAAIALGEAA